MNAALGGKGTVHLLGIRHHGPGSARAVVRELERLRPDAILIEGPPEADDLIAFAADDALRPPVALLCYATADPRRAAFWPFAVFSPEWQAIRYGVGHGIPVRFCDLPAAHRFAEPETEPDAAAAPEGDPDGESEKPRVRVDPIGALAEAAGYEDAERWWDDVIEHRLDGASPFEALAEAMTEVRGATVDDEDARREAYMRTVIRATARAGAERIAVVCGAWHVPALAAPATVKADTEALKGLPKTKTTATWVPWTHGRLASWRGYGAGVASPGWYHHLFTAPDRPIERWLVDTARLLRDEDVPISSAHVIEGIRFAETLATLRNRPLAGLDEVVEATRAVLCDGSEVLVKLVAERQVVGEMLGGVPETVPTVPLAADLAAEQRRLRLKPAALASVQDLDLRTPGGLSRSQLLHRLALLGVAWGRLVDSRGKGTFRESWELAWHPEFAVDLVEASAFGTTVREAATAKARKLAADATLADLTGLVETCLLADLPDALGPVLRSLDDRVALDNDVAHLLAAVPPLARTLRYGDVRGTDTAALATVTNRLVVRACAGLPAAVTGLDDDAARALVGNIDAVHGVLGVLPDDGLRERWLDTLAGVVGDDVPDLVHGRITGRLTRILHEADRLDADETARRMGLVLTAGVPPARGSAWVAGFLSGGALLLVHDPALLGLLDRWLTGIPPDAFTAVLPLLRRTFGDFPPAERRAIGEAGRHGARTRSAPADLDPTRAAVPIPTVARLLGVA